MSDKRRRSGLKKQTFIKGSIILMVSAAASKLLGAVFKIPLTNILGGVGMSYFSCAYSLFMPVYSLTATGLSSAVARMTAQSAALGMYGNIRRIRRTALLLFSGAGLAGSLLIYLLAKPFSYYVMGSCEASAAVAMIAPAVLFGCITAVERGYYEGMSNMYPTAFSQAAEGVVKAFAGLFLCAYVTASPHIVFRIFPCVTEVRGAAAAAGITGVTLSMAGAALFLLVTGVFFRCPSHGEKHLMSRRSIAKELTATALPVGAGAVVTNLTSLIDMWTVIWCIPRSAGSFVSISGVSRSELPGFVYGSFAGIALTVFNLVPSVTNMLGKGALTCITAAYENGDRRELERSSSQALLTSAVIAVPAAVGLGLFAPELLAMLYPRQSDEAELCTGALRWLMTGMVCLCASYPLFSMLQAVGRPSVPLKIMLAGSAVKLCGNLLLIPFMGINGAALSTSLCYVLIFAAAAAAYRRVSGVRIDAAPFAKVIYAGAMCGGAAILASSAAYRQGASSAAVLFISAAAGGTVYVLLVWRLLKKLRRKADRS
ncbi:polysaccharide biosynthesis C-terminal domain-containing protein [Ruminococcus flavefaciens]|uniref:MATE family efflux transporter n=1 Tax=Ruminococcus flavefaciens TaxID=1265 RepID=UPI001FA79484|nr:polysaccharide biosynthesis C-terminal domain-containing protein [Ruminococcus flavefaciens]